MQTEPQVQNGVEGTRPFHPGLEEAKGEARPMSDPCCNRKTEVLLPGGHKNLQGRCKRKEALLKH